MRRVILATHNEGKLVELREILRAQLGRRAGELDLVTAGSLGLPDPVETGTSFEENALLKARDVAARTGCPAVADDSGLVVDILGKAPGILSARWAGRHGDDAANNALLLAQLQDIPDAARTARFLCCAALVVPAVASEGALSEGSARPGQRAVAGDDDQIATDGSAARPSAWEIVRFGEMAGYLLREPRGANGFGYDPLFVPTEQPGRVPDSAGLADQGASASVPVIGRLSSASRPPAAVPDGLGLLAAGLTSAQMSAEQKNAISHRGKAFRALGADLAKLLD